MSTPHEKRDATLDAMMQDVPTVSITFKDEGIIHRMIGRIYPRWLKINTVLPTQVIAMASRSRFDKHPTSTMRTLQHEWVHIKDQITFFGIMPRRLSRINVMLFYMIYLMPQLLALLGPIAVMMGASFEHLFLLAFMLPIPSPGRMLIEMRAYRRSIELGADIDVVVKKFTGSSYMYMWPFKGHVRRMLQRPSPYASEMNGVNA